MATAKKDAPKQQRAPERVLSHVSTADDGLRRYYEDGTSELVVPVDFETATRVASESE